MSSVAWSPKSAITLDYGAIRVSVQDGSGERNSMTAATTPTS
jgi:hypothetical protein